MSSVEAYVLRIKPAIDVFLKDPTKTNLAQVEQEVKEFDFGQMSIFVVQIVVPLVTKLNEISGESQELRTSLLDCLRHIIAKLFLTNEKGLRTILAVVLQQIRDPMAAVMRSDLSEEIKLAVVLCITTALKRSTSDVLESFYTQENDVIIGQILLTLMELISREVYRTLVSASLECLMVVFYVQDEADAADVVLRNQVANTLFIYLPKIVTVLFKTSLADDKIGETIKSMSIKALGRIICIMFEETTDEFHKIRYDSNAFRSLLTTVDKENEGMGLLNDTNMFASKRFSLQQNEERLRQLKSGLRSDQWVTATSRHMRPIYVETSILRAHNSVTVRKRYAEMCCLLLKSCAHSLKGNFIHLLESVLALSEDEEPDIAKLCHMTLADLQQRPSMVSIFNENAELLLDAHLNRWPGVLHRCDESEQFSALLFFKGFLRNLSADKLKQLLVVPIDLELFVTCMLMALNTRTSRHLLNEDYSLRRLQEGSAKELAAQCSNLSWRQFEYLSSKRCVKALYDVAAILGAKPSLNRILFHYCQELIEQRTSHMNEAILFLTLMITPQQKDGRESRLMLAEFFLHELLNDEHWHLALQPDAAWRLKVEKPTSWFADHTPGIYSSAIEVRTQDCDSDDEVDADESVNSRVRIIDAQLNVLHTCLVLDAVGHCAKFIGDTFDRYIFRSLHKVLLKLASSNTMVHQAATFAFVSMQLALKYAAPAHFIECSTDYLSFHLTSLLKKSPGSSAAVDILTVVLQYRTRGSVPQLSSIYESICEESAKMHQSDNIHSYLRVFNVFLSHLATWQSDTASQIADIQMHADEESNILSNWLNVLNKQITDDSVELNSAPTDDPDITMSPAEAEDPSTEQPASTILPRHIEMTKKILEQTIKFVSSSEQSQQIPALECLATGIPLLSDYENELLPLVHLVWQPLVEKFRQKDSLVLSRCFSLLHILALHAKEFILKRSLSDVIPQVQQFLMAASKHSCVEVSQAQEYKLQLKLLQQLASLIRSLQLEGKHLHDLLNIAALYLSQKQPKEMQVLAVHLFENLASYNGPFVYVTLLQRAHLKDYKSNVDELFRSVGFTISSKINVD
ncbi:uncharacterized protein LOC6568451 [Drosophila grimshawi]|uniref:GH14260 n=1 Tax=Drosophila grimshawi TaxID=7222 RepID=B4JV75_DROGR|nr:uncharacterized protein LOC6568451 [Drosophila grimshawi]EDV91395.1 GH14260 [Drosophila grimshawi]